MISQSLFLELGSRVCMGHIPDHLWREIAQFVRPHVLVIHRPSGVGFYLGINMDHVISVNCCREPENPAKIARGRLPEGFNPTLGLWYHILPGNTCHANGFDSEFNSYWLY